jgi:hypothetical protein
MDRLKYMSGGVKCALVRVYGGIERRAPCLRSLDTQTLQIVAECVRLGKRCGTGLRAAELGIRMGALVQRRSGKQF